MDACLSTRAAPVKRATSIGTSAVLVLLGALATTLVFMFAYPTADSAAGSAFVCAFTLSLMIVVRARRDADGDVVVLAWAVRLLTAFVAYRLVVMANTSSGDWIRYDQLGQLTALDTRGSILPRLSFKGSTDNVVALVGYLYAALGRSPMTVVVFESALGLVSSWLYLAACRLLVRRPPALVRYGLLFFPSFVFWTTMIGKDPFVALGLALGVYGAVALGVGRRWTLGNVAMMAVGVCLCLLFRPYLCLVQVPALLVGVLLALFGRPAGRPDTPTLAISSKRRAGAVVALILGVALMPFVLQAGMRKLRVRTLEVNELVEAAGLQRTSSVWRGGSNTGFSGYASPADVLRKMPESLGTLLFRPFPWEARHGAAAVAAADTLLFLGLWVWVAVGFIRTRSHLDTRLALARPAVRFLLVWTVLWTMMFMNMTANLGTMVRHRVQIVPVVLLLAAVFASRAVKRPEGGEA